MSFETQTIVRFAHVDAAGIVFYPRYFEMVNAAVEDWFAQAIGVDFATMHLDRKLGIPTVRLETEFFAPSRLGDLLDIVIAVDRVGTSSANLTIDFACAGQPRLRARVVIVCMDLASGRAESWPEDMCPEPREAA